MVKGRPKAERETKRSGVSERTLDDPDRVVIAIGEAGRIPAGLVDLSMDGSTFPISERTVGQQTKLTET